MFNYFKSIFLIFVLVFIAERPVQAEDFDIREQKKFFCQLEKYDQCFYTGKCTSDEYKNYTDYFDKVTDYSYDQIVDIYNLIPKIYRKEKKISESGLKRNILEYDSAYLFDISNIYMKGKYNWLTWFKHKTGISHQSPKSIFTEKESDECGAKMFNKYLSLPLPEDADLLTCIIHYQFIWSCLGYDKELSKNLFCQLGNSNCIVIY